MVDETTCPYCGEPAELELFEVWSDERAFMLDACCEDAQNDAIEGMQGGTREPWARDLFAEVGIACRQVYADDCSLRIDFGLELADISRDDAKAFVRENHRHNKPPCGWRWGHAVYNGNDLIGVAMVGRPVARMLDKNIVVEANRVCVRDDIPQALRWNACSMLYGASAREAKRRGFERIVTYTLETEDGTTLRAAGWEPVATTKGGTWNRPSRARVDSAPTCKKVRWERLLNGKRKAVPVEKPAQLSLGLAA